MKNITLLNPEHATLEEIRHYRLREAARAVVIDNTGKIALLHVAKNNYYKLPGGGIEENEDKMTALKRECIEEIGCVVEVEGEVGIVTEYRKSEQLKQISYCYLARKAGEEDNPHFTAKEIANGFKKVWMPLALVLDTMENMMGTNQNGQLYIVPRDMIFIKEAAKLIGNIR